MESLRLSLTWTLNLVHQMRMTKVIVLVDGRNDLTLT